MSARRSQRGWWAAVTVAVLLGTVVAWYRHRPEPAPMAPAATAAPAAERSANRGPQSAEPGPAGVAPPSASADAPDARQRPGHDAAGRPAAPDAAGPGTRAAGVPEFFAAALANGAPPPPEDLRHATPQQLQALMDSEPRDEAWAAQVEWQLENYLALQPHQAAFGNPTVQCRTSVCRVISTTTKRSMSRTPEADWHELMNGLQYETVSNEFAQSQEMIVFNHARPEEVGYVTYFTRAQPAER